MAKQEETVWGIHAGRTGDADTLFLKHNCIALGWHEMGDLSGLKADREAFKAKVAESYPGKKSGAIPVEAGQLFRFIHEMQTGDLVVYPSKHTREVHIGRVDGPYRYDPALNSHYPNIRPIKWLRALPRIHFSQGALYEVGSAMSLFQIKNYADEFRTAVTGKTAPKPVTEDATVALVAEEIEQTARDFILKRLAQELKGHGLAHFVAHLLETMGYRTRVSPEGPDGGIDIIAHRDELGFEPPIIKVQVKSGSGNIGEPDVKALSGNLTASTEYGLFVTLGGFTSQAVNFARVKSNLRLIDGMQLIDLILLHYEQLNSRYKGLLPLKQVYIPEALEEDEG